MIDFSMMRIVTNYIDITTSGDSDLIKITDSVQENLRATLLQEGQVTLFVMGTNGGIITLESDNNVGHEQQKENFSYLLNFNNFRHSLVRPSMTVPFKKAKLLLGNWQQIVFLELETKPKQRRIVTQFIGL